MSVDGVVTTFVTLSSYVARERLGLLWRHWVARRLVGFYLADRTYHRLNPGAGLSA